MDVLNKLTTFLWLVFCAQYGRNSVVRRDVDDVTEPMVTMPLTEEVAATTLNPVEGEEPARAGFSGWNRDQVLRYMSETEDASSDEGESADRVTEESLKLLRIAEIQYHILQALGISDPTAYSTPKLSEDEELRLISTLNRTRPSTDGSNVVKTFECMVAACEMPINQSNHVRVNANPKSMQLYFDMNFCDEDRKITQGILKIRLKDNTNFRRQTRNIVDSRLEVRVYRYLSTRKANGRPRKVVVDAKIVSRTEERWVLLNIKPALKHWRRIPSDNYGLEIVVRKTNEQRLDANKIFVGLNCSGNDTNLCLPARSEEEALGVPHALPDSENSLAPNLHVVTMEKEFLRMEFTLDRRRREAEAEAEAEEYQPCYKQPLTVSLSDLGRDNLTFTPNVIEAGFCVGNCTADDLELDNRYCSRCVPTKMGSLFLAYKDSRGNAGSGSVKNVVVEECGLSDKM
ncbi:growth/differentiation factor 3-like [Liolophura sinensis]|uniref:growth/differentiation factor 3-like n=1 Tax=Liolophura sinensis TaxID=3198878 RepID=UPI0031585135